MWKKITAFLLSAAVCITALSGCGGAAEPAVSGAASKDWPAQVGEITLQKAPSGVAVLSGNLADVVLALGYETTLKARSADSTQPELSSLPAVNAAKPEEVKAAGADLAITDQAVSESEKAAYESAGITLIAIKPATGRADLTRLYSEVGSALKGGRTGFEQGAKMAEKTLLGIDSVSRMIPNKNILLTGLFIFDLQGSGVTGGMFQNAMLECAGITNIAQGQSGGKIDLTTLKRANPQVIFCSKGLKAQMASSEVFKDLAAVKNNRVYEVDPSVMKWQGASVVGIVADLAGIAYPELLQTGSKAPGASSAAAGSRASSSSNASSVVSQPASSGVASSEGASSATAESAASEGESEPEPQVSSGE